MTATQLPRPSSPGRPDTPVLGETARHRSAAASSPSSLASSLAWARRRQANGARSSRDRIAEPRERPAGTETQAELETSRRGRRALPRTGPAPGAVPRTPPPASGEGFSCLDLRVLQTWGRSLWPLGPVAWLFMLSPTPPRFSPSGRGGRGLYV